MLQHARLNAQRNFPVQALALLMLTAVVVAPVTADESVAEPVVDLPEPYVQTIKDRTVVDLTLPGFFGGPDAKMAGALEMRLFFDGDTNTSMYATQANRTPVLIEKKKRYGTPLLEYAAKNMPFVTLGEVKRDGDRITGEVRVHDRSKGKSLLGRVKLDLTVKGEQVTGTYTGVVDKDDEIRGDVTGEIRDPAKLSKAVDPIRDGYDWPRPRGIDGLGSATPIDQPIVDALAKGRFLWKSEARWPIFYTGGGSHVVAGNKVILNIYLPAGDKLYAGRVGRKYNTKKSKGMDRYGLYSHDYRGLREADDVVFCIDAQTGLTLWKAVLPRRAVNWQGDQKANPGNTACVADGKVFVVGYAGNLYALDLESGKLLWEGYHGGETGRKLRTARENIRESGAGQPSERIIGPANSVATYQDGVLLVSSQYLRGIYAYDAATGKRLWQARADLGIRGLVRLIETPDGKKQPCMIELARVDGRYFRQAVVLDLKTGERLIETEIDLPKTGDRKNVSNYITWKNYVAVTVGGDAGHRQEGKSPRLGVAGLKLTDQGFEKVWEHHLDKINGAAHQLIIMDGRLHLGGHRNNLIANIDVSTGKNHGSIPGTDGQGSYMQLTGGYGYLFRPSDAPAMVRADPDAEHVTDTVIRLDHGYLQSTPDIALVDGRVIVRQFDGLVCLDLRQAAERAAEQPNEKD